MGLTLNAMKFADSWKLFNRFAVALTAYTAACSSGAFMRERNHRIFLIPLRGSSCLSNSREHQLYFSRNFSNVKLFFSHS
jgi:hypothetical protein